MRGRAGMALAAVGRHSLHVFCVGLFLSYGAAQVFRAWPDAGWWLDPLLIGGGAAVLIGFARIADRRRRAPAPLRAAMGSGTGFRGAGMGEAGRPPGAAPEGARA
jgi:hypothetical protein